MNLNFINNEPFLYLAILSCALLTCIYFYARISENWKVVIFNLAFILLIFSFMEVGCLFKQRFFDYKTIGDVLYRPDSVRGYCPQSDQRIFSKCIKNGKVVYDVVYTVNHFGLRISPHDIRPDQVDHSVRRVVFFGCSFTFGQGVNDNETLPFVFENNSHGKYLAYNFGLISSGPHQMLALLENGDLDHVLESKKPEIAIYQALPCHIQRAAFKDYGLQPRANMGPRYILNSSHRIELRKSIKQSLGFLDILSKSVFFHDSLLIFSSKRTESDRELFIEIVKKSKEVFESKYGGKFCVIYWDLGDDDDQRTIEALRREGMQVIPVSQILGEYKKNRQEYFLAEGHPNKKAYQKIAQYLLNKNY